jgi:hypothetical protein
MTPRELVILALSGSVTVTLHDALGHALELLPLLVQLAMRPAPLFGRVRRQLATVDGEVLLADQPQLRRIQQHVAKQADDLSIQIAHERRDGGEVRPRVRRQRHEHHVAPARLGQPATGDDPLVVPVQDHLQQDLRIVCRPPRLVVGVA